MTDVSTPGASARPYSQTPFDERGNFHYEGDLYRPGDNLATLAARIEGHLKTKFPDTRFAIRTEKLGRGRKIIEEILDTPDDLTARDAQNDVFVAVRDPDRKSVGKGKSVTVRVDTGGSRIRKKTKKK